MAGVWGPSRRAFSQRNLRFQRPRQPFRGGRSGHFIAVVTCTAFVATGASCMMHGRSTAAHASQRAASLQSAVPAGNQKTFTVLPVGTDGNCMFRALAQSRSFTQDGKVLSPQEEGTAGAKLRSEIVAEMQRQKDTISLFIDQDWNSYIRRMSQSGTWGGEPELAVAPHVLGASVQVYQYTGTRGGKLQLITEYEGMGSEDSGSEASRNKRPPVPVVFYGQHYDALLDEKLKPTIRSEL